MMENLPLKILACAAGAAYSLFLPGYLLSRLLRPDASPAQTAAFTVLFSTTVVPLLSYSAAVVFRTNISITVLLFVATTVNAAAALAIFLKARTRG